MGKISSEIDIIPVKMQNLSNKMSENPYIADRSLVPRVRKYLESNENQTYIDINTMADDLRKTYVDYRRLKQNTFRTSVKKAYQIVLQSYGGGIDPSSDDDDESNESAQEENNYRTNPLNAQLADIYRRAILPKQMDENELIDISSDDSEAANEPINRETWPPYPNNLPDKATTSQGGVSHKRAMEDNSKKPNSGGKRRKIEPERAEKMNFATTTRKKKSLAQLQEPSVSFKDIGGMDKILEDICQLLIHVKHPEVYRQIGISPPRGFLLHGPPGCGKTLLANAIAGEIGVPLLKVAAPELVAGVSGESEERVRELFERAALSTPCILFIDEIDAITPNRQNAQKEMERRIVAQLLTCLDDLGQNESGDRVLVIGATNRPDAIDPALRRAGRFDREICLGIPNLEARMSILKILTEKLKLSAGFDYESLARFTPGFVGADLMSLTREAAMAAVNRMFNDLKQQDKLVENLQIPPNIPKPLGEIIELSQATATTTTPTQNADSTEIIVDDDPIPPKSTSVEPISDNSIEVIDVEAKTTIENGHHTDPSIANTEAPIKIETKIELTRLQQLLQWLHFQAPLSSQQLDGLCITMDDFGHALKCVQPSAKREGFATVPDVTWADIGSLNSVREELQMAILAPIRHEKQFAALGLETPTGVMLCGPPGCGKTLLAKAIANEAGINFISVKGPELLNMYVGESERAVRVCFERARNSAPCVIFFDELDAICPKRSDSREGGSTMRVVNQMLTEMDGVGGRKGVYLLAATNRPDIIDSAVLRPGRFDKILYVGLPTGPDRIDILTALTKGGSRPKLAEGVDLGVIGGSAECQGYTGADLAALVREAGMVALKETMAGGAGVDADVVVKLEHFMSAIKKIRPSVPEKDRKHYEKLRKLYAAVPGENDVEEMEYS